ncbi:MAG: hypothetical protein IPL32_17610 [Chloracidobacterium sp.]|nr:hypothetical protein [Chloracidobacterium sp.]
MEGYPAKRDWKRECKELEALVAQQAAVIEQMREALQVAERNNPDKVLVTVFSKALALQPCPEVLNKVRADAVRELYNWYMDQDVFDHLGEAAIETFIAQRIEKGEA